jgi:hypothetical protein
MANWVPAFTKSLPKGMTIRERGAAIHRESLRRKGMRTNPRRRRRRR